MSLGITIFPPPVPVWVRLVMVDVYPRVMDVEELQVVSEAERVICTSTVPSTVPPPESWHPLKTMFTPDAATPQTALPVRGDTVACPAQTTFPSAASRMASP